MILVSSFSLSALLQADSISRLCVINAPLLTDVARGLIPSPIVIKGCCHQNGFFRFADWYMREISHCWGNSESNNFSYIALCFKTAFRLSIKNNFVKKKVLQWSSRLCHQCLFHPFSMIWWVQGVHVEVGTPELQALQLPQSHQQDFVWSHRVELQKWEDSEASVSKCVLF